MPTYLLTNTLSLLNSAVATYYFSVLNPSINLQTKDIKALPFIYERTDEIEELARQNFEIAKNDWNASETSFEFSGMQLANGRVKDFYEKVKEKSIQNYHVFMENLQRIDDIFSEIYGISRDELPEIEGRDIAVSIPTEDAWIKKLISYSVGCMFGRYSLDEEGIMCTSEAIEMEHYSSYSVDPDNIIPISDSDYFEDDILVRFVEFISVTFGEEYVEENLDYIANVLGGKGTAKEIIRNYFINDFYKEHCSEYSVSFGGKRPIYWCFDSGKENGFKCLVYMHRYNKDTVGRIRSDYLLRAQSAIENALKNTDYILLNSTSSVDKAQAAKNRDKYIKQLSELKMYYQALSHIALQQITLDLNEGVRANYSKFQNIEVVGEGSKKQIVDLLAKI